MTLAVNLYLNIFSQYYQLFPIHKPLTKKSFKQNMKDLLPLEILCIYAFKELKMALT